MKKFIFNRIVTFDCEAVEADESWIFRKIKEIINKGGSIVAFLNPSSYLLFDNYLLSNGASKIHRYMIFIDGISLVLILNFFFKVKVNRFSFDMTSVAPVVFSICAAEGRKVALVGGTESVIRSATSMFSAKYPGLDIVYIRNGYFSDESQVLETQNIIMDLNVSVVVVGMGTPHQEKFLEGLYDQGYSGTGFTCGGFFDQSKDSLAYYPEWINKWNLRALYRLYKEPKRLWRRYLIDYPKSVHRLLIK
jgi:N-acetylglucosaminyldiphosphoundecaprenol N-acetyl-beta-D-mannosaminyltransferase